MFIHFRRNSRVPFLPLTHFVLYSASQAFSKALPSEAMLLPHTQWNSLLKSAIWSHVAGPHAHRSTGTAAGSVAVQNLLQFHTHVTSHEVSIRGNSSGKTFSFRVCYHCVHQIGTISLSSDTRYSQRGADTAFPIAGGCPFSASNLTASSASNLSASRFSSRICSWI